MCYILEKHGIQHTFEKWKNWQRPRQKSINHKDPEFSMSNCQNIASSYVSKVLKILQLLNNYPNFIHFPCSRPKTVCLLSLAFSLNQVMLVFLLHQVVLRMLHHLFQFESCLQFRPCTACLCSQPSSASTPPRTGPRSWRGRGRGGCSWSSWR